MSPRRLRISVAVDPSALRLEGHRVLGPLCVRGVTLAGRRTEFPDPWWVDRVALALSWWVADLAALRAGAQEYAVCRFPEDMHLELRVEPGGGGRTYVVNGSLQLPHDSRPMAEWSGPGDEFAGAVWGAARAVLRECEGRGWAGPDVVALRAALASGVGPPAA